MKRIRRAKILIGFTPASRAGRSRLCAAARLTLESEHNGDRVVVIHFEERIAASVRAPAAWSRLAEPDAAGDGEGEEPMRSHRGPASVTSACLILRRRSPFNRSRRVPFLTRMPSEKRC
jgi:hypothetical protein